MSEARERAREVIRAWWDERNLVRSHDVLAEGVALAFMEWGAERERLALERAAAKICTYCRDGAPIVEGGCDFYPKPEHRISFSQHVPCAASAIRGLIQEGDR